MPRPGSAALVLAAAIAATASADVRANDWPSLAGSAWRPVELGGESVPAGPDAPKRFVRFEAEGRMAGNAGCNRFFASYETVGDKLEIGPIGATRMACPQLIMEWEERFMRAVQATRRYERRGVALILTDGQGNVVARLRQRSFD